MDDAQGKRVIEAILFVSSQSVSLKRLAEVLPDLEPVKLRALLQTLNGEYAASGRAFGIQEVAGGYQLVTDQQLAPWIKRALQSPKPDAVSTAALETLAIIAYRQPMTKADIEAIRGVDVTASLDTLIERRFVRIAGRKDSSGRPFLYATTVEFLRHFGLKSIEALPRLDLPAVKEATGDEPSPAFASAADQQPASMSAASGASTPPEPAPSAAASDGQ